MVVVVEEENLSEVVVVVVEEKLSEVVVVVEEEKLSDVVVVVEEEKLSGVVVVEEEKLSEVVVVEEEIFATWALLPWVPRLPAGGLSGGWGREQRLLGFKRGTPLFTATGSPARPPSPGLWERPATPGLKHKLPLKELAG